MTVLSVPIPVSHASLTELTVIAVNSYSSKQTVRIFKILHLADGADIEYITRHSLGGGNPLTFTVQPI
ncbi:hypothetical protein [Paraglaciecola arctica]|uniref:Uncharacterized protein n=1 Tax=Paraglaciecola arctica BSs20135 TaxID=493475 RepID=K6Y0C8_9ALTE|nr:hypothetical protein [Paraglaciecola arctica]GAC17326.1 hypothetical protein GARC_0344 [Paraglaciecola arctica BSs20135]